jgi:long-chain acyl-CoA synthetase
LKSRNFIADIESFALTHPETLAMLGENSDSAWTELRWKEIWPMIRSTAFALLDAKTPVQQTLAICSPNRPEWTVTDIAAQLINAVIVPLHAIGNEKDTAYILDHAQPSIVFAGGQAEYDMIIRLHPASVSAIVVFDTATVFSETMYSVYYGDFISVPETESLRAQLEERKRNRKSDDLFTIVYTSGTTGQPKGVMLTHANFDCQVDAFEKPTAEQKLVPGNVSVSFLPLSHIYERQWNRIVLYYGFANAYLAKPGTIIEASRRLRPATFCAVPRIFEKIHCAVEEKIASSGAFSAALVRHALSTGRKHQLDRKNGKRASLLSAIHFRLMDSLVLRRLRAVLGGNVRYVPCGGAPLSSAMQEFFCSLGITIRSGYGLTETCGGISSQDPLDYSFGSTGKPAKGVQVRIGPEGELLLKSGSIMKGYYKDDAATRDAFTADGFFKTGDIGRLEANGEIRITDRIKDLMKTSGGKYIAPQPIEALFTDDIYIEKVALIADRKSFVSALIEPNKHALMDYAKKHNISFENYDALLLRKEIKDFISHRITARTNSLAHHEKIKAFALMSEPFSIEKGELTPSLKLKRKVIAERHRELINSLYKSS